MEREDWEKKDAGFSLRIPPTIKTKFDNIAAALDMSSAEFFETVVREQLGKWEEEVERRQEGGVLTEPKASELRAAMKKIATEVGGRERMLRVNFTDLYSARGRALHLLLDALWGKMNSKVEAQARKKLIELFRDDVQTAGSGR